MSNHFPEVQDLSVCVVLPAYHAAKTLRATLDRLPSGACQDIILVDDASTDDTVSIVESFGDARVTRELTALLHTLS